MPIKKGDGPKLIKIKQANTLVNFINGQSHFFSFYAEYEAFHKAYFKLTLYTNNSQNRNTKHLFQKKHNSSCSKQAQ